jgi:DNA-binding response OmpR family regulator
VDSPSHTVLVVDDDRSIRFLCRVNLELEGWTVREAGTLAAARRELEDRPVEVMLLDLHVGSESGLDFLDELRRDHPAVRVALLTGSAETSSAAAAGADAVIAKPFTLEQLVETVRGLQPRPAHNAG